jgi:hypothetical protein
MMMNLRCTQTTVVHTHTHTQYDEGDDTGDDRPVIHSYVKRMHLMSTDL